MERRRMETRIEAGPGRRDGSGASDIAAEAFREALSRWASTVVLVAVRDGEEVHATTVTSFAPVAAEPPTVLVSLGPNARVLPFLEEGTRFAVSFLTAGQTSVATAYADAFPVGPSPFPPEGPPVVRDVAAALECTVERVVEAPGDSRVLLARVDRTRTGPAQEPLLYHGRTYRTLRPE